MGSLSAWHWIIVGLVAVALFGGKGRISGIMGDVADGIRAFRKGVAEDEPAAGSDTLPACSRPRNEHR